MGMSSFMLWLQVFSQAGSLRWTDSLATNLFSHKSKVIPLSILPKDRTSKFAALTPHYFYDAEHPIRKAVDSIFYSLLT